MQGEIKVREQLDSKFTNTNRLIRRNPQKYMRNPTNVYFSNIGNKSFAMYDLPGYKNIKISNFGQKVTSSPDIA